MGILLVLSIIGPCVAWSHSRRLRFDHSLTIVITFQVCSLVKVCEATCVGLRTSNAPILRSHWVSRASSAVWRASDAWPLKYMASWIPQILVRTVNHCYLHTSTVLLTILVCFLVKVELYSWILTRITPPPPLVQVFSVQWQEIKSSHINFPSVVVTTK